MPEHVADDLLRDRCPQHFDRTCVAKDMRPPLSCWHYACGGQPTADHAVQVRHCDIGCAGSDEDFPHFNLGPPKAQIIQQRFTNSHH